MFRISARGIACLAAVVAIALPASGVAQLSTQRAPVPRQVLVARSAFIGNGGSESYGADSYFRLTKYDGGPDRAYNSFYNAVRDWGHYEVVGATTDADLLLVIRFTNPVVDREHPEAAADQPNDWLYDPQLNLAINDPKTGLSLWTITEHIEPANDKALANEHYDQAVTRLVDDLKGLILHPEVSSESENIALPPGAIAAAQREQREKHAGIGLLLGSAMGGLVASHSVNAACTDFNLTDCERRASAKMRNEIIGTIGGAIVGALVGWVIPVGFPR
jgi:hypothetical protein